MARVSTLAGPINRLLQAKSWESRAERFTICATEPALEPIEHIWMAGDATAMTSREVIKVAPGRIIVPDDAPPAEIERLKVGQEQAGREPRVSTFTRFIDVLWGASAAAGRARRDGELQDSLLGEFPVTATPDSRHVPQKVMLGSIAIPDHRLLETALSVEGSWLAILADAGLGKSELLQWHEWRRAVRYESARAEGRATLPAVALRIPLRDLRSLSLDAIAHYLSHPDLGGDLQALRQIETGQCLRELLLLQRVVLLLDGVDELTVSRDALATGLRELRRVVSDGGRIVLTARKGHHGSGQGIAEYFRDGEVAQIEPMPPDTAHQLLVRYGASPQKATDILKYLTGPAKGIPLFLLMAYKVDLRGPLKSAQSGSRTNVLLDLVELFCMRDESRVGVTTEEQMRILTLFAHWSCVFGALDESTALESFGIDANEPAAAIFQRPHALLTRLAEDVIQFKYPQFSSLFLAKAFAEDWATMGFDSTSEVLRSRKLDDATVDYMARLVGDAAISRAWKSCGSDEVIKRYPLIRRNVLALALARVDDEATGADPSVRSARLAAALGERRLEDVSLSDLALVRLDLDGWTLRRLQGRGGALQYCTNLARCDYDESIHTLDSLEGTALPRVVDERKIAAQGIERLSRLVKPLRRRLSPALIRVLNKSECRDPGGWAELRRAGLAAYERIGTAGNEKAWKLTDSGVALIGAFAKAEDSSASAVHTLVKREPALGDLVVRLGR